jgi:glycosyltransferase involved in cell wall biosynthesis
MRRQKGERDQHYAFVNYASMQAADRVVFNSRFHHDAWFEELPRFLRHFPEFNELASLDDLRARSSVLPVGIDGPAPAGDGGAPGDGPDPASNDADGPSPIALRRSPGAGDDEQPPLLLWNQRWEYDKNPGQMVHALCDLQARGVPFRLALCGQSFSASPSALDEAREAFADRLVHYGFADSETYRSLLRSAEVTTSTAEHEFFGIAVLEAMAHGACAVLPDRLSYPELLDDAAVTDETRRRVLYRGHDALVDSLAWALSHRDEARRIGAELARAARRFRWQVVAPAYDELFGELCGRRRGELPATPPRARGE